MKKQQIATLLITSTLLYACTAHVQVKHHQRLMGPDTWEATNGKISIAAYRGTCWEAEKALKILAEKANSGKLDWSLMALPNIKSEEFKKACAETSK